MVSRRYTDRSRDTRRTLHHRGGDRPLARGRRQHSPALRLRSRLVTRWNAFGHQRERQFWIVDPATGAGTALTHSERYGYANSAPRWDPLARSTAEIGGTPVSEDIPPSSVVVNGVLETSAPITGLAADGRRIAVDLDLTRSICPHTEIWESDTRTVQSLSWSDGCWSDICDVACEPATIASSAFAGSQYTRATLWCTFHDCHDHLESASLDAPHLTDVTPDPTDAYGYVRAFADTLLAGDGDLTVHADQVLRHGRTTLWRIQGHVALPLRKVDGKVRRLAVDSGRIATEDANGNITLREADAVAIWHQASSRS